MKAWGHCWCDERDREGRAGADYIICMRAYSRHGARGIYIYNVDMLCHYIIPVLDSQSNQIVIILLIGINRPIHVLAVI